MNDVIWESVAPPLWFQATDGFWQLVGDTNDLTPANFSYREFTTHEECVSHVEKQKAGLVKAIVESGDLHSLPDGWSVDPKDHRFFQYVAYSRRGEERKPCVVYALMAILRSRMPVA